MSLSLLVSSVARASANDIVLMSYSGHNETIGPYWVAVDKGLYQKHGIDARLLQVRNAQISLSALVSGEVPVFLPSVANVLSGVSAGFKIACVAFPINGTSRELVVRKEIESLSALRGKTIGVQSIGGGFWLQTMMVLDGAGVDPEKFGMKVVTLPSAGVAKRGGMRSLVNSSDLHIPLQTVGICGGSERLAGSPDLVTRLTKGMIDGVVYILDARNQRDVVAVMKKHLRLSTDQDAETSYHSLRSIASLDVAPNPAAWKNIQRFIARVNPKAGLVDVNESINLNIVKALEDSGYLTEARKKVALAR